MLQQSCSFQGTERRIFISNFYCKKKQITKKNTHPSGVGTSVCFPVLQLQEMVRKEWGGDQMHGEGSVRTPALVASWDGVVVAFLQACVFVCLCSSKK